MSEYVLGVDGCTEGWLYCRLEVQTHRANFGIVSMFSDLLTEFKSAEFIGIDIPIGLWDERKPRACDVEARKLLGQPRGSSVFPAPARSLIGLESYGEANSVSKALYGKGLSAQAHGICKKILEVDQLMDPSLQTHVVEVHPEVCFWGIQDKPLSHSKRTSEGYEERRQLLQPVLGLELPERSNWRSVGIRRGAAPDDMLDAAVAANSARQLLAGTGRRVPERPEIDPRGLRMEINF